MHDEPDPGSNILLLLQNVNIKIYDAPCPSLA